MRLSAKEARKRQPFLTESGHMLACLLSGGLGSAHRTEGSGCLRKHQVSPAMCWAGLRLGTTVKERRECDRVRASCWKAMVPVTALRDNPGLRLLSLGGLGPHNVRALSSGSSPATKGKQMGLNAHAGMCATSCEAAARCTKMRDSGSRPACTRFLVG